MARTTRLRILFLETRLDTRLESTRSQAPFMKAFFSNFSRSRLAGLVTLEVHSEEDLCKFMDMARDRRKNIKAIHIVSHGGLARAESYIELTNRERVNLADPEKQSIFTDLNPNDEGVEMLFFSCCQLGRKTTLMERLRDISGVDAVFSYRRDVNDYQAFLVEALFYHLAYGSVGGKAASRSVPWGDVHKRLEESLKSLKLERRAYGLPLLEAAIRRG